MTATAGYLFEGADWALVVAAVLALVNAHIGLSLVFLLVTIGAIRHRKTPSQNPSVNILYWGISMMLVSLMVGYLSAKGGKLNWETDMRSNLGHPITRLLSFFRSLLQCALTWHAL
jgi:uncharacterized membrane protein